MSEPTGTSKHVDIEQVQVMIDFMGQHAEFASGKLRTLEARHKSKELWEKLTALLNDCGGIKKSPDGWSKYWSDWKNKLKNKTHLLKTRKSYNARLTRLEKKALSILGPEFSKKKKPLTNGFASDESSSDSPLIKSEDNQGYEKNILSDEESDDNSDSSHDEDELNSNEALLQNLYPKWLKEVEKKRADAELYRAKAEEQRASVAVKAAEAAVKQAEALKKLAEATANQADALVRIALVLEARGERDVLEI